MTAGLTCRACGREARDDARFCDGCGAPISEAAKPAEYKQVTVLFADVVHSMDLAGAVGPERLREIMAELVDLSADVVQRFGGTVDKFTGDGVMALFGAPIALEDHATRACMAALAIQDEVQQLAREVSARDGAEFRLRVGLNSGQVIAGDVGSKTLNYTAIGDQVGMAQRMESVAPAGGVMLSESTARLVERTVTVSEPQLVRIKGAADAVPARRLIAITPQADATALKNSLVGRDTETTTLHSLLERSLGGRGCVVGVTGPPGIGKTRLVNELVPTATQRGLEVTRTFCESHASDIPFHVVARLLRDLAGVTGLDDDAARARVHEQLPHADPEDLLLLNDLLGIADPAVSPPDIDPDARRRRLTVLVNAASLSREEPTLFVVEDLHWSDEVSESMLAEFATAVIPQTHVMVLFTYRPEYRGPLSRLPGVQKIVLAPLNYSQTLSLAGELLGHDPSVHDLTTLIATRAAGNPFFVQEMVRDVAERGILVGDRGHYVCRASVADIEVPPTLQATIAARIDRLAGPAKRTLTAAAVIGSRFPTELLTALGVFPVLDELLGAELIEHVAPIDVEASAARPEYAFCHPLIRAVAYESQLISDRAALHGRLARLIEEQDPASADENAAVIAEHLEAARDTRAAYEWHMRAAAWASSRDLQSALASWERASQLADALPSDTVGRNAIRIAPRTMLCANSWRVHVTIPPARFTELRDLCSAVGDNTSLAIAMSGLIIEHFIYGRIREAGQLASECMVLVEAAGDDDLLIGLSFMIMTPKNETAEFWTVLAWAERVIELAAGDPARGNIFIGSPLAVALALHAQAAWWCGRGGWRQEFDLAVEMARRTDPISLSVVLHFLSAAIPCGVVLPDDIALRNLAESLSISERSSDDISLGNARMAKGLALVHRRSADDRARGLALLTQVQEMCVREQYTLSDLPMVDLYVSREHARNGDADGAIPVMRRALDELIDRYQFNWAVPGTRVLVEALLARGSEADVAEAQAATERLASLSAAEGYAGLSVMVLRLRALLAAARADDSRFRDLAATYRTTAESLGFEGHIAWAREMH